MGKFVLLLAAIVAMELSPKSREAIAPVHAAIVEARTELASLPPPKDDAERLIRMEKLAQAPREAMSKIDFSQVPEGEREAAFKAIWAELTPIDQANQEALLKMLPEEGWFTISRYGKDGSEAAFMIVQHGNVELWRRFVPVLEPLAARGEVKGAEYALMFDRLAIFENRPQRYGSQMRCENGKRAPYPIEEPGQLDVRRAKLGMIPYASYLKLFEGSPPC